MKNILSIIDEVIGNPDYDNYFSRQLRDLIARKGIEIIYMQQDFLSHLQTEEDIKKNNEGLSYELDQDDRIIEKNISEPPANVRPPDKESVQRTYHNYNIQYLSLSNFRKFPNNNGVPYGICCMDNYRHQAKTTILYGGNGCGKSSLYEALQFVFGVNTEMLYSKSLHHANDGHNNIDVRVLTNEGLFNASQKGVNDRTFSMHESMPHEVQDLLGSFFCSEIDITTIAGREDISEYIYQQIGYGEAYHLCQYLHNLHQQVLDSKRNVLNEAGVQEKSVADELKKKIVRLVFDISMMEEGLADTYSFIKLINDVKDRKELYNLFNKLHTPINLSYNPDNDGAGRLTTAEKNERFEELKNEIAAIIDSLKTEKKKLAFVLPEYAFMLGKYDDLIIQFEILNPDNDNRQHLQVKKTFFDKLAAFNYSEQEQKLLYHIERVKRILNNPIAQRDERDFFMQEAKELITANTELERLKGRELSDVNLIKLTQIDSLLYQFLQKFREVMNARICAIIEPMRPTIESILRDFDMDSDEVRVSFESQNARLKISYLFHSSEQDANLVEFTPQQYLNSFRLKLYGLSVKVALSFAIMKAYNFNFPLVLDDVIFASDFYNRKGVKDFIQNLLECYRVQCKGLNDLQIIFFTHDEVVFDAVIDAFPERNDYIQGYLFDHRDVDQTDEITINKDNFYNIYVRK